MQTKTETPDTPAAGRHPDPSRIRAYYRRRKWAAVAWTYAGMIFVATVILGVFFTAFVASVKNNPLEYPFSYAAPQLSPVNWFRAAGLGRQGNDAWMFGGLRPGRSLSFEVVYAVAPGETFDDPEVSVPRIQRGSRAAALIEKHFAADFVSVDWAVLSPDTSAAFSRREKRDLRNYDGTARRYHITIDYPAAESPVLERVPLAVRTPKHMVLIDSTLPPTNTAQRGRVAYWSNISPGAIGYAFKNYVRTFTETVDPVTEESLFLKWFGNSFLISAGRAVFFVFLACTAGYVLARITFPGRSALFALILFSMMIPPQVLFVSNYLVLRDIGLLNTIWGVVTVMLASQMVFIMKQFFESFPREIEEAAIVDGASPARVLFGIVLPNARPAVLTVAILSFQHGWNDFFWPLVIITQKADFALPVGLLSFRNLYGDSGDWGLILAGAFLSILPVLLIFFVFQRQFVEGSTAAGVKG